MKVERKKESCATPCHCDNWQDCPRVEEFRRNIEGMAFRGCNDRERWKHEPLEKWVEAIENDQKNLRTLCKIGVEMGIFTGDGKIAKIIKGCTFGCEVMRQICKIDKDVLSASIAASVGMMGIAASESERLADKHRAMKQPTED